METEQRTWVEKVYEADERAEYCFQTILEFGTDQSPQQIVGAALITIAAELRAARIAARPAGRPKP